MMILGQHSVVEFESSIDELQFCMVLLDKNNIEYKAVGDSDCPDYVCINLDMVSLGDLIFLVNQGIINKKDYEGIFDFDSSEIRIHHNLLV